MSDQSGDDLGRFEKRARDLLRDSADNLDGATRSRLTQARHAALSQIGSSSSRRWLQVALPGGAVAVAAVVGLMLWNGAGPQAGGSAAMDDLELLADAEGYDLSQEPDLGFIEWAAAMGDTPAGT